MIGGWNAETTIDEIRAATYQTYDGKVDNVEIQYEYLNFLNNSIYSVRFYDKVLSEDEIKRNYYTDMYRFGSGSGT